MADRHCIFAWTETNAPEGFPGYVNISRDENGKHTITVRSRGNAGRDTAIVEIPPEALESLLCDLAEDLYRDDVNRLMATPEAEVDAELRRLGVDPVEAARQGKAAVEGALETIRARNAGVQASGRGQTEGDVPECETCNGVGTIDERLGGYSFSNPAAECPDCGGTGEGPSGVLAPEKCQAPGGRCDQEHHCCDLNRCAYGVDSVDGGKTE